MPVYDEAFWNDLYSSAPSLWSGAANPQLMQLAERLTPGAALDVGSGEGGDSIWLAGRGWQVTAVDLSSVALDRARAAAEAALPGASSSDPSGRIDWQQVDLLDWTPPESSFDLVSSQYMQLPSRDMRALVAGLAAAVRPGGTLLVVGHADEGHRHDPSEHGQEHDDQPTFDPDLFFTAESFVELLEPREWQVVLSGPRPHPRRHGTDTVLHARRTA